MLEGLVSWPRPKWWDFCELKGSGVFCSARRTQLHIASRWKPCRQVQMEAMRSGKMTVEALVEQVLSRKVSLAKRSKFGGL